MNRWSSSVDRTSHRFGYLSWSFLVFPSCQLFGDWL